MHKPLKTLRDRIIHVAEIRQIDQAEATRRGGFSNSAFINDIYRGHKESVRGPNVARLATAYSTTSNYILGGTDNPELPGTPITSGNDMPHDRLIPEGFSKVRNGGSVEAGSFRAIEDFEDAERENMYSLEPAIEEFPNAQLIAFTIAGDSMNDLVPRPIMPGDRVVCLEYESLGGRVPLRDGMVLVVEQTLDGGHHRERSVKQIELYDDRVEFWPRSRNARHKPIVVDKAAFRDASEEDGRRVTILAWVRRISNDLPV